MSLRTASVECVIVMHSNFALPISKRFLYIKTEQNNWIGIIEIGLMSNQSSRGKDSGKTLIKLNVHMITKLDVSHRFILEIWQVRLRN